MKRVVLVAVREFVVTVSNRAFIVGLLVMPVLIATFAVLGPRLFNFRDFKVEGDVRIIDPTGLVVPQLRTALDARRIAARRAEVTQRALQNAPPVVRDLAGNRGSQAIQTALGPVPIIIAHEETKRLLSRAKDPNRPLPTVTFSDRYSLKVGTQRLELSYHGDAHEPGNIFIYAPDQQTLMVIDMVFPGWMPWRRFALAHDIPGYFAQMQQIRDIPFKTLVGGHVARTGTHADVDRQIAFLEDLKVAATRALGATKPGAGLDAEVAAQNPWAVFDDYIDRVVIQCVNELTPTWSKQLAAYDIYIWDQCYAMEQSLRID